MRYLLVTVFCLWSFSLLAACPPDGHTQVSLAELKSRQFVLDDNQQRQRLALALLDCLHDPNPALRDGIGFEALSTWLRGKQLDQQTIATLTSELLDRIEAKDADTLGVGKPFAALVLSELLRADRVDPQFSEALRTRALDSGITYLSTVRDYRGFDPTEGWRHAVAHSADWIMQMALNPAYDAEALKRMREAIRSQIVAEGAHAYTDGESERLARATLVLMHRQELAEADWLAFLAAVAAPAPFADWASVYGSRAGLAKRHNTRMYLFSLYFGIKSASLPNKDAYLQAIEAGLFKSL